MERSIIDNKTGEIITDILPGDRILRQTSIASYRKIQKKRSGREFVKVNIVSGRNRLQELNANERSMLFSLQFFVPYGGQFLQKPNGKPLSFADIVSISGMSRGTANNTLKSLVQKGFITKSDNNKSYIYYLDSTLFMRGEGKQAQTESEADVFEAAPQNKGVKEDAAD